MNSPTTNVTQSLWALACFKAKEIRGLILERIHAPAKIREFEYVDPLTNEIVYISTGARYSVLHVGAKRFFFDRVTGQFDGTGELLQECVADGLELLN